MELRCSLKMGVLVFAFGFSMFNCQVALFWRLLFVWYCWRDFSVARGYHLQGCSLFVMKPVIWCRGQRGYLSGNEQSWQAYLLLCSHLGSCSSRFHGLLRGTKRECRLHRMKNLVLGACIAGFQTSFIVCFELDSSFAGHCWYCSLPSLACLRTSLGHVMTTRGSQHRGNSELWVYFYTPRC